MNETHLDSAASNGVKPYSKEWWIDEIKSWKTSGLTAKEWCEKTEEYSYSQFIQNRIRYCPEEVNQQDEKEHSIASWTTIQIGSTATHFDIECRGVKIPVYKGFDQELLKELIEVIRD